MTAHNRTLLTSTIMTKQPEFGPDLVNKGDLIEMLKETLSFVIKMVLYLLDLGFMSQLKRVSVSVAGQDFDSVLVLKEE